MEPMKTPSRDQIYKYRLLDSLGLSVPDLQAAGADPHDLKPLKNR